MTALTLAGMIYLGAAASCFAQPLVSIVNTESSPVFVLDSNSTNAPLNGKVVQESAEVPAGQHLYLAFVFRIDFAGMNYLRFHGRLPIYQLWVSQEGPDRFDVGITGSQWASQRKQIEDEFSEKGEVIWPTFGNKKELDTASYSVSIRDPNNHPIVFSDHIGWEERITVVVK